MHSTIDIRQSIIPCKAFYFNGDGDVDLADFAGFQRAITHKFAVFTDPDSDFQTIDVNDVGAIQSSEIARFANLVDQALEYRTAFVAQRRMAHYADGHGRQALARRIGFSVRLAQQHAGLDQDVDQAVQSRLRYAGRDSDRIEAYRLGGPGNDLGDLDAAQTRRRRPRILG